MNESGAVLLGGDVLVLDALHDFHPALDACGALERQVHEEIAPEIAWLFTDAIRRRLPWTWEPN